MERRETVEMGIGYAIHCFDGLFFVDYFKDKADGFETLQGARKSVYYAGLRDTK